MEQDDRVRQALKQSKGVFIMPAVTTGAMIVGAQNGEGVLLKHNSDGSWSEPAFLTLHAASIRAQASGKSGSAAMILMSDRALRDFQLANSFSFDGNSGLSIVDYSGQRPAATGTGDIVLWSIQPGGFASATVSGSELHQDLEVDQAFYGRKVDARRILNGEVTSDRAVRLKSALPA
jgi:lipid-binding SYLF domain-containing protein